MEDVIEVLGFVDWGEFFWGCGFDRIEVKDYFVWERLRSWENCEVLKWKFIGWERWWWVVDDNVFSLSRYVIDEVNG